jgi:DNA-binding CsgD family transcriptional regulator
MGREALDRAYAAISLVGELKHAPTVSKAIDLFEKAIEPFGVRYYALGPLGNPERTQSVEAFVIVKSPRGFMDHYHGIRAYAFDPLVRKALCGSSFFWRDVPRTQPEEIALMRDSFGAGMVDGFVAVHPAIGALKAGVTMSGARLDWSTLEEGSVSLVAGAFLKRVLALREVALAPPIEMLSPREIRILHHAALGRSDKIIARHLGISPETVRGHWKSIRKKLGAADRAHAIAVGLWSGQIAP